MSKPLSDCHSEATTTMDYLPIDYVPAPEEVIVGRGKMIASHPGNKKMRALVQAKLAEYATAHDKTHKTYVISEIFDELCSGGGGFVKKDHGSGGRWYRLKDSYARTNIAQCFCDHLQDSYRSSKFSKQQSRRWQTKQQEKQQHKLQQPYYFKSKPDYIPTPFDPAASAPMAPSAVAASERSSFSLRRMLQGHAAATQATSPSSKSALPSNMPPAVAISLPPNTVYDILSNALDVIRSDGAINSKTWMNSNPAATLSLSGGGSHRNKAIMAQPAANMCTDFEPLPLLPFPDAKTTCTSYSGHHDASF